MNRSADARAAARLAWLPALVAAAAPVSCVAQDMAPARTDVPSVGTTVRVGDGVYEPVVYHATGDVFVATIGARGQDDGRVYVLDGETLEEKGTIHTPGYAPYGLGVHEGSGTLYATDTRGGAVIVIDIASQQVTGIIENDLDDFSHLRQVVTDEANNRVYVSSYDDPGSIWVIDTETQSLADTFLEVGDGTSGLAIDTAEHRLFAANMGGGDIVEIDLATGEYVRRFPAGGERPTNLTYDADRRRLWSSNQATNDATVIDVDTGELIQSVSTGDQPVGIRYNPVNDMVYVANRRSGLVTAVDAERMNVLTWMLTGSYPNTVVFNRETGVGYATNKARSAGRDAPPVTDPHGNTVTILHR